MTSRGDIQIDDLVAIGSLKGYVLWEGEVATKGTMLGIELLEWDETGNDGSHNGKFYFTVRGPGWGMFCKRSQVKFISRGERRREAKASPGSPRVARRIEVTRDPDTGLAIGDVVVLRNRKQGEIMYIGKTDFFASKLIGLKLSNWSEKAHNGTVKGKEYFKCHAGYGYFTKPDAVTSTLKQATATTIMVDPKPVAKKTATVTGGSAGVQFGVGDKVKLNRGRVGVVKYIGKVDFTEDEVVGLELAQWSDSGNDGQVKGKRYFTCQPGRGYFTKKDNVSEVLEMAPNKDRAYEPVSEPVRAAPARRAEEKTSSVGEQAEIGDFVRLRKGREGTIRFIGKVDGVKGELIGMELQQWVPGKDHDGDYNGKPYFTCRSGTGYWTKRDMISKIISKGPASPSEKIAPMRPRQSVVDFKAPSAATTEILDFKIGDTVKLKKGRIGVVKFYGKADFASVPVVGLELTEWSADGGDGTVKGKRYFECNVGRAYFTRPGKVTEVIKRAAGESSKDTDEAVFCGFWPGGSGSADSPRAEGPAPAAGDQKEDDVLPVEFGVGDEVMLKKGRKGKVRFYGKTEFSKGLVVGLELNEWSPTGGDGTVKGNRYFICTKGRAYFTRPGNVAKIIKRRESAAPPTRRDSLEIMPESMEKEPRRLVEFMVGDRVRLTRGRVGTVKFIGKTHISKDEVVGLELEQWSEKGNDGCVKGKRYFETRGPGWGYFTKPENIAEVIHMP